MILLVVWKAMSTVASSRSEAAKWKVLKMFFQPDLGSVFVMKMRFCYDSVVVVVFALYYIY